MTRRMESRAISFLISIGICLVIGGVYGLGKMLGWWG